MNATMSPKSRYLKLLHYVRRFFNVQLYTLRTKIVTIPRGWTIVNSGCCPIIIISKHRKSNYNRVASILIHEFGHALCFLNGKRWHTEWKAWQEGLKNIPVELKPDDFEIVKNKCLETYRS